MKFRFHRIGPIREAELELGDLTTHLRFADLVDGGGGPPG